jgi:hypothetical protein
MEGPDIFYPSWFVGTWNVESVLTDVQAPCGVELFGGSAAFERAKTDIGKEKALGYESRFLPTDSGNAVADREFNVKSIARAAMGQNSVIDIQLATPNKFSCLLAPVGAPSLLTVDMIALNRRQEYETDEYHFDCSEVVREITSPVDPKATATRASPLLKEIETTSLYSAVAPPSQGGPVTKITCRQRSAAFLLPSQQDPVAFQMWRYSKGRPIDVRFYDVAYTKR